MAKFRRHPAAPVVADAFQLVARLAAAKGMHLSDALKGADPISAIRSVLDEITSPIRLYGKRVEEMFAYMTISLAAMRAIKREETADLIIPATTKDIVVPDYRVILADGREILVEVKNINEANPHADHRQKVEYLERIHAYGRLFSRPTYLAVYWSRWRIWTLHTVEDLIAAATSVSTTVFSFAEAFRRSEMRMLGDMLVATRYPLVLRFGVESQILKRGKRRSQQLVTIRSVEISVAGTEIRTMRDQRIALGFMLHGNWSDSERVILDRERITAVEFSYAPIDQDPDEEFAIVGSLSSLASSQFNDLTVDERGVRRLSPGKLPAPPYPGMNENYNGIDLPLWRLIAAPGAPWTEQSGGNDQ